MLVNGKEILKYAQENNVAIPAFGCVNLEGVLAIVKGAESFDTPVILQMTEGGINYAGLEELYAVASVAAAKSSAQICIHLDHGRDLELVKRAIDIGFTSVMYDGSHLPLEENMKNSKMIKDYIGNRAVALEVEIGTIGGKEDDIEAESNIYANIEDVCKLNEYANPDSIAVAVGTAHGIYKGEIKIDFGLIKQSKLQTNKPIVLHGTSGVPKQLVQKAIENGVCKVNYDTELKQQFIGAINNYTDEHEGEYDIRKIFKPGIDAQIVVVEKHIETCIKQ